MKRRKRHVKKRYLLIKLFILVTTSVVLFITGIYASGYLLGPPSLTKDQSTIYYSAEGDVIGNEKGPGNLHSVSLEDIPDHLIHATLAVEDQHFYSHHGFDFKRIARALITNLQTNSLKEGASTLTQQYARNLFLTHEKTWVRKLKEAFYTIRLEMFYSKDELLEGYLNVIYYGHGAYGIEAASETFFGKKVDELSLAEATMLVGIPKGPTYYSPFNDEQRAKKRQESILQLLRNKEEITEADYVTAKQEELNYAPLKQISTDDIAPYFQDVALKEASRLLRLPKEAIKTSGYRIYTTLNMKMQQQLEEKIEQHVDSTSDLEVGALAIHPKNGAIRALVGGRSYSKSPFNRAVSAKRMTGSSFKPFLYYTALNHGYNATTMLTSKPTAFELDDGKIYQPSNYNDYYAYEPITLAQALALSDNIYAVKTNLFLGPDKLVNTAKKLGITSALPEVPSLALGTVSISVDEMVTAYGILANGGRDIKSYSIKKIVDRHGKTVYSREETTGKQILDPNKTFILTDLMTGMFDDGWNGYMPVTGSTIANRLSRTYAGKSGTTNADSWMIGYSPSLVTGVWTGYDDNRPMKYASESAYAKNIWASFMEAAHKGLPNRSFRVPAGVVRAAIDPASGRLATPYCPTIQSVYFEKGSKPTSHCTLHFYEDEEENDLEDESNSEDNDGGIIRRLFEIFS
ncbi:transglycosylase domain-containing protein [Virgibacillus sp. W0181]|uniref:transglycosylase domain-containing protein n=1 Tax=Virgibacillus sp. W0181 TaxID=3391581 RepID=UPI003F45A608